MKLLEVALWACGTALLVFYAGVLGWGVGSEPHAGDTVIETEQSEESPRPTSSDELPEFMPATPTLPPLPARGAVTAGLRLPASGLAAPVSCGSGALTLRCKS